MAIFIPSVSSAQAQPTTVRAATAAPTTIASHPVVSGALARTTSSTATRAAHAKSVAAKKAAAKKAAAKKAAAKKAKSLAAKKAAAKKAAAQRLAATRSPIPPQLAGIAACIRRVESGGNYSAYNPRGGYSGAYQFDSQTWRAVTGTPGPAAKYSPATQDAAFAKLYSQRGGRPWAGSGCG